MQPFSLQCTVDGEAAILQLAGSWRLHDLAQIERVLAATVLPEAHRCVLDGAHLESIDTAAGHLLLRHLSAVGYPDSAIEQRRFEPRYEHLLALTRARTDTTRPGVRAVRHGPLWRIGAATMTVAGQLAKAARFAGAIQLELLALARRPSLFRSRETLSQFEAVCVDAIPIVMLINFLIGVVVAYVLGVEAQRYGADLFVADGVVIAVCRELSPILSSVLVAGRSGAAFTAQIGTMKVAEEVDAITTLGLSPVQVLVIPRLLALAIAMPILVLVGDLAGGVGGMIVCSLLLHITPDVFIDRVHTVLEIRHVLVGLSKAPMFALFIAMIACRLGLDVTRDARSVGENTTSTVVQCIVWVIVLDAAFAILFQRLGI
jgi:phospholipid/cholesterol/gamma-HCH transport system permease protein